jgi:uncharacterized damage-inducible protein DinB
MTNIDIEHLKFPIGKFSVPETITSNQIQESIEYLRDFPSYLADSVIKMSEKQLDTAYRPGGWTIKQVIHHVADSHMNAFSRFKLALTEDNPTIKPYDESAWANLADASLAIDSSMAIIKAVHFKWVVLLQSMTNEDFQKTYFHPEKKRSQTLAEVTLMYTWHSKHHLAHVHLPSLSEGKF